MGRYITTTGTAGAVFRQVTANYNAQPNDRILMNSAIDPFTIYLPTPSNSLENDMIQFMDVGGALNINAVTVDANGGEIMGDSTLTLDVKGITVTLIYTGIAGIGWFAQT